MKLFKDHSWTRPRPQNLRQAMAFKLMGIATSARGERAIKARFYDKLKLMLVKERAKGHAGAHITADSILGPGVRSTRGLLMVSMTAQERKLLQEMRTGKKKNLIKRYAKPNRRPEHVYFNAGSDGSGRVRLLVFKKGRRSARP